MIDPKIIGWARGLGTMISIFRQDYLGMDRDTAIKQILESWGGAEVTEISDEIFIVVNKRRLEPFQFRFITPRDINQRIDIILVGADPPFWNVMLFTDGRSTNYSLGCPPEELNKYEKQLCKALEKYEGIPKGHIHNF